MHTQHGLEYKLVNPSFRRNVLKKKKMSRMESSDQQNISSAWRLNDIQFTGNKYS